MQNTESDDDDQEIIEEDDDCNDDGPSDGSHSQNGSMQKRKKKTRTVFSRAQVFQLESTFDIKRYLIVLLDTSQNFQNICVILLLFFCMMIGT